MRKQSRKKLSLNRETVLDLARENLTQARGAGQLVQWSDPPECDPACSSQTLSCTL